MTDLAAIQRQFLQGQALMLDAFNQILAYLQPPPTGLYPQVSGPFAKPKGPKAVQDPQG